MRQLLLSFHSNSDHDSVAEFTSTSVLSKSEFQSRTLRAFNACSDWLDGNRGACQFDAERFGVFDTTPCEWTGTFADRDRVALLEHDWHVAATLAIAIEDAALHIQEHGHADTCPTIVRSFYLALTLRDNGLDLERLLPGFPVLALEE